MENFLSFTLGNAVTIVSFIVGGIMFVNTIRKDVSYQGERLTNIEDEMKKMREVIISIARQEERMSAMDQRMLSQGARIDDLIRRLDRSREP
jgi:hypothetical protein